MARAFASVGLRRADIPMDVRVRFIRKLRFGGPGRCWQWTGCTTSQGYGHFRLPHISTTAQRVAYALLVGDLPPGLTVDHLCRNRACVNPAHLEAVPHRVNILRGNGPAAQHARRTHCPRCGAPYSLYEGPNFRQRYCAPCKRTNQRLWMRKYRAKLRQEATT